MLRSLIISLSKAVWAQRLVTGWEFARWAARRFIAGETPESAIQVARDLNSHGVLASLDHLGENTLTTEDARHATGEILVILDQINRSGVKANVSVKLTQIGMAIDPELCRRNLESLLVQARQSHNFVRLDMEDSRYTTSTINLYKEMRQAGYDNVGVVIQASLRRSVIDLRELTNLGARVRLCKGAYFEPPQIAFPKKTEVDDNYDRLAELLIDQAAASPAGQASNNDGFFPPIPALATHDLKRIEHSRRYAERCGLPKNAIEFQMLHGIRRNLQESLAAEGYPVRVYVPYGTHWYPYLMRRLAERPANLWFFISNFFRR